MNSGGSDRFTGSARFRVCPTTPARGGCEDKQGVSAPLLRHWTRAAASAAADAVGMPRPVSKGPYVFAAADAAAGGIHLCRQNVHVTPIIHLQASWSFTTTPCGRSNGSVQHESATWRRQQWVARLLLPYLDSHIQGNGDRKRSHAPCVGSATLSQATYWLSWADVLPSLQKWYPGVVTTSHMAVFCDLCGSGWQMCRCPLPANLRIICICYILYVICYRLCYLLFK